MIAPQNNWHKFISNEEKFEYLQSNGFISKKAKAIKDFYYKGAYSANLKKCDIIGFVDLDVIVIQIDNELHCISSELFKEIQPTKEEIKNLSIL